MKALLWTRYGGPEALHVGEAVAPVPSAGEVLIRVKATGLNAADLHLLRADPPLVRLLAGLVRPRFVSVGADVAGVVTAVGTGVTRFRVGDRVLGDLSGARWGGLAEFAVAPEKVLATLPAQLTWEQGAALPMAAVTAYQALVKVGGLRAGQTVLVHGASGGVGTYAVQIAKALGASVTAVCSARNTALVASLGADQVLDYHSEDFVTLGPRFDVILAANGDRSLGDYRQALAPKGVLVCSGGSTRQIFQTLLLGPLWSRSASRKYRSVVASPNAADLEAVLGMVGDGRVRPILDRTYPFDEAANALAYLEEGHAQGKVVVTSSAEG